MPEGQPLRHTGSRSRAPILRSRGTTGWVKPDLPRIELNRAPRRLVLQVEAVHNGRHPGGVGMHVRQLIDSLKSSSLEETFESSVGSHRFLLRVPYGGMGAAD